jgi:5-hydroxyisourate hydrolase
MGYLTTHVLDTTHGKAAVGMKVVLRSLDGAVTAEAVTNSDGRLDRRLLDGPSFASGTYELTFYVGDYFRAQGLKLPQPAFLEVVPLRFGITEDAHYHVPLLVSPYAYSTYRGS